MTIKDDVTFGGAEIKVYSAGAGCGKTASILKDIENDLKSGIFPDEIAFVTFTKKGVLEGISRAAKVCVENGFDYTGLVNFRTLHSLCFREIGYKRDALLSAKDFEYMNKKFKTTFNTRGDARADERTVGKINSTKIIDMFLSQRERTGCDERTPLLPAVPGSGRTIKLYYAFKKANNKIDYFDCLKIFVDNEKPIEGIKRAYIDEAQDLTELQWQVCRVAFHGVEKVTIAGDSEQAIFLYGGSKFKEIINYAESENNIVLDKTYRLPRKICLYSKAIQMQIRDKIAKDVASANEREGEVLRGVNEDMLVEMIAEDGRKTNYRDGRWMCLYRADFMKSELANALLRKTVPFFNGQAFCLSPKKLSLIKKYEWLKARGKEKIKDRREFAAKFGVRDWKQGWENTKIVGDDEFLLYKKYIEKFGLLNLLRMVKDKTEKNKNPFVLISTIHKVKGGEADNVSVSLTGTRKTSANKFKSSDEEMRVFYVACTRAKERLVLIRQKGMFGISDMEKKINLDYKRLLEEENADRA